MKKTIHVMYFLLALTLVIGACTPAQPAPASTEDLSQQIEQSVALTIAASNALTAAAVPTNTETPLPPTNTPFPTLTPLPTLTPFSAVPVIGGGGGSGGGGGTGGGGGPTQDIRYSCKFMDQTPLDGSPATILKVGDKLDVTWVFKNDGTKTWLPTWNWTYLKSVVRTDYLNNKSLTMSPVPFTAGIATTVKSGETVTLRAELTAPPAFEGNKPIWITTYMVIIGDGVKFCTPFIQVEVIRPGMTP